MLSNIKEDDSMEKRPENIAITQLKRVDHLIFFATIERLIRLEEKVTMCFWKKRSRLWLPILIVQLDDSTELSFIQILYITININNSCFKLAK